MDPARRSAMGGGGRAARSGLDDGDPEGDAEGDYCWSRRQLVLQ